MAWPMLLGYVLFDAAHGSVQDADQVGVGPCLVGVKPKPVVLGESCCTTKEKNDIQQIRVGIPFKKTK